MRVEEYLLDKESVTKQVSAFDNVDAMTSEVEGTLACTPFRLVYVRDNNVTDISINEVNSIEYTGPSYPKEYLNWGIFEVLVGVVLVAGHTVIEEVVGADGFGTLLLLIGGLFLTLGLGTLIWGYFIRRATLKIHTPSKTYEFASNESNLDEIGHTVRGYEMKNNNK